MMTLSITGLLTTQYRTCNVMLGIVIISVLMLSFLMLSVLMLSVDITSDVMQTCFHDLL
jgi:hypothetical protein